MAPRRHAIGFGVTLDERIGLEPLAQEVSAALGVELGPSEERGLQDDYVGEMAGLMLWLRGVEPEFGPPEKTILLGRPEYEEGVTDFVDIGPYIAELLSERTGRPWSP